MLPRGDRVLYVRKNLANTRDSSREPWLNQDEFAAAVGAPGRQGPIRWESGGTPRDYAAKIAELTPYPAEAFGADGEAELVRSMLGNRLESLEGEMEWLRSQLLRCLSALGLEAEPRGGKPGV